jgi:hypothetical protein
MNRELGNREAATPSGVDLVGAENLRRPLGIRGQPGKFTPQTVEEMCTNAPEWVLNSLVLGEITSEEFIQHYRLAEESESSKKILDVLNTLVDKALQSKAGKLEAEDALVALELTGGIPGEDEFMRGCVFEDALCKYKLAKQRGDEAGIKAAFTGLQSAFEKKYNLSLEDADYITAASITKDQERIVNLQESLLPFSPMASRLVIDCSYNPARQTRLTKSEAADVVAFLEFKRLSQELANDEVRLLQAAEKKLKEGVLGSLARVTRNGVENTFGGKPPSRYGLDVGSHRGREARV